MAWFRKPRLRFLFVYPLAIWLFLTARVTEASLRAGVALAIVGELIRLWANGYVGHRKVNYTEPEHGQPRVGSLITAGPYAFVRHPLYVGTWIIGLAFCVAANNLLVAAGAFVAFYLIYRRKIDGEEQVLRHEYGETFEDFRRHVPRLLPTLRRYGRRNGAWSWRGVMASKELKTAAWLTVLMIGLYFYEEAVIEREPLFTKNPVKHAVLLGLTIALMAADGLIELAHRRRRHAVQHA